MATNGVINGTMFGVYAGGTKIAYATSASISMNHNLRDTSTKDSGGWRMNYIQLIFTQEMYSN